MVRPWCFANMLNKARSFSSATCSFSRATAWRLLLILSLARWSSGIAAPNPSHSYSLNGTYADDLGGPSLMAHGGSLTSNGYAFLAGQGLTLSNAIPKTTYSIEVVYAIAETNGYRKLLDFKDRTSDNGLYNWDGK